MPLKRTHHELRVGGEEFKVTPDEIDRYETVTIPLPTGINVSQWFGSWAVAGTAAGGALVIINAIADWPRNAEFSLTGTGVGMAGTATITGKDQFGSSFSEAFGFGSADNGGTVVGTRVFAQVTSGTLSFGTAVGNGTARLGMGTAGTTSLFGLPFKVGGTTDLKMLSISAGTGARTVNGGTIAAFIDVPNHALKLPGTLAGTLSINAWVKSSFDAEKPVAQLTQRT